MTKVAFRTGFPIIDRDEFLTPFDRMFDQIVETGRDFSLIVLSDSGTSRLKRLFLGSVSSKVLDKAKNSVLVIR
mgnify:CR=1 FL=1